MARNVQVARLFFDLEMNTKGLDNQLTQAERSLGRTASFIQKNVVAAAGAAGVALVGLGVSATQMAGEVDAAMRRVAVAVPGAIDRLDELKEAGADLSKEFGISQTEIAKIMEQVARTGVESADELIAASRAAVRAQRATGEEFSDIIGLIDTAMDNFGVSAADMDAQLAKLIATTKGKLSLAELKEVLEKIGPTAKKAGVDLATMVEAIVTVRPTAKSARDAIAELDNAAEQPGGIEALAAKSHLATDGIKEMAAQIDVANGTIENQSKILREQLNAEMIRFGDAALPIAIKALQFFSDLLGGATTKMARFTEEVRDLQDATNQGEAVNKLAVAMREVAGAAVDLDNKVAASSAIRDHFAAINQVLGETNQIQSITASRLQGLEDGLTAAAASGKLTKTQMLAVAEALSKINAEQLRRQPFVTPKDTAGLDATKKRLEEIEKLAASGAGLDGIRKALGTLSKAETDAANKAIANHKKAEGAANARVKAEQAAAKAIIAAVDVIGAKMSVTTQGLKEQGDRLRESFEAAQRGQQKVLDATDEIARLQAKVNELLRKYKEEQEDAAKKEEDRLEAALRMVNAIGGLAHGFLGAAQAAGLLSDETAATLGHVINIAEQIASIKFSGKDLFDPANLASLGGIVGSLVGVLSSLFSGESPESKAHKALIKRNNEVLDELVKVNGDLLKVNQPGAKIANVGAAISGFLSGNEGVPDFIPVKEDALSAFLRDFGLTISDIEDIADELQLQLRNPEDGTISVGVLRQIIKGIGGLDSGFANTFQGDLDRIRTFIEAGILDPMKEFAATFDAGLKRIGPNIAKRFEGVNPFTAEGRSQSIDIFKQLLKDFDAGLIKPEDLGGLTPQQFIDFITNAIGTLASDQDLKPLEGSDLPTPQEDRPPIELSNQAETSDYYSNSIAADETQNDLLTSGLEIQTRQADTLDAILEAILKTASPTSLNLDALLGSLTGPVAPPALPGAILNPASVANAGGVAVNVGAGAIPITVNALPGMDAGQIADEVAAKVTTTLLDRTLGDAYLLAQTRRGILV